MIRPLLIAALVCAGAATVPSSAATIPGGERLTLSSKVMGEERTIFVSLPESYGRGAQRYPVLYLTDAETQFDQIRATASYLAGSGLVPEMIVVGVTNTDRLRDLYASHADFKDGSRTIPFPTSGHADRFLNFFEKELIPWAESKYRTAPFRILAGHSAGGNFALHAMRVKPVLFQAIIAASPWLAWDDHKELKLLEPFLAGPTVRARALFFTSADESPDMKANVDALTRALLARKDASLRWGSSAYPDEIHDSVSLKSDYDGLRMIFAGWSFPRDPDTNRLAGSLDDVKIHYARLGERLGFPILPPEPTVNELGYQYLQLGQIETSLAAFRYNAAVHPKSANVWDSLGEALEHAGKKGEALVSYDKAVSLAESAADPNLEVFRKHAAHAADPAKAAN